MRSSVLLRLLLTLISFVSTTKHYADEIFSLETCNIPEEFSLIGEEDFAQRYGGAQTPPQPVVFRSIPMNKYFLNMLQIDTILRRYGNKYITVTTANTHSYKKQSIKLNDYIDLQTKSSSTNKWGK